MNDAQPETPPEEPMNEPKELEPVKNEIRAVKFTQEQKELIKRTIAVGHTDDELALFLNFCMAKRLDPFAREIYSIKRDGKASIQMGIDGLRARGEDTGHYAGQETLWCGADGVWVDVWLSDQPPAAAKVLVFRKDTDRPFVGIAKWDEYKPGADFMWKKMPSNQLAKCAEALALRKAFPRTLGGIYVMEELQAANSPSLPPMPKRRSEKAAEIVDEKTGEIQDEATDSLEDPPPAQTPTAPRPLAKVKRIDLANAVSMKAKFTAPCKFCGKPAEEGTQIMYVREGADKGGYHAHCVEG